MCLPVRGGLVQLPLHFTNMSPGPVQWLCSGVSEFRCQGEEPFFFLS